MIKHVFRTLLFAIGLMLVGLVSYSQSKNDSLLTVWKTGEADATTYNALIWVYVFNQPDSAIFFGHRGENWCKKSNQDSLLASIHNRVGVAYDIKSMPDSALHFYGLALDEAKKTGNRKTEGGALNNIGLIYWNQGRTDLAIDHYIRSAEIFEETDNKIGLGNTYNNIGLILMGEKQYLRSLEYHQKALKVRQTANHKYGLAASYSNIAQTFTVLDPPRTDSAIYFLLKSIPLKEELNDKYGLARSYHSLAEAYNQEDRLDDALAYHIKALHLQIELGNTEGSASSYYNIADIFNQRKDYKTQLAYLDSAQIIAEEHTDLSLLWKIYRSKARSLGRQGQTEDAHLYWIAYDHLKDSLVTLEKSRQIEELETQYRTAEKDKEIAEKKAELADTQLKVANKNKWIVGLTSGLFCFLFLGFAIWQKTQRKAQAEKDSAIIKERERGLKAIIQATEEERKRIAKDLHDGIVQTLTGLSLRLRKQVGGLSSLDEHQAKDFKTSQSMLDDAIGEVRGISHEMMPRVLNETGLILALEDMLQKSLGSTEINYEFEHHKVDGERFKENVEISLYRICQELVNNIIKHSQAKAVSVQLLKTKSHLVLVVEDNGKGFIFNDAKSRNGIGLMNIESRAKAMNGEVNYEPSPERGTVATIRIPLT